MEERNGTRIPKRISNSQFNRSRDLIINWLKLSLIALLNLVDKLTNNNEQSS